MFKSSHSCTFLDYSIDLPISDCEDGVDDQLWRSNSNIARLGWGTFQSSTCQFRVSGCDPHSDSTVWTSLQPTPDGVPCKTDTGKGFLPWLNSTVSAILYRLLKSRPYMSTLGYQTWAYLLQKARNYVHKIIFYN